jgi:TRAP-type mannitol/chloroaromatic compound transport system permease small subunit
MQKEVNPTHFDPGSEPASLKVAGGLRRLVNTVGGLASWLIIPLVLITCTDVIARKLIWRTAEGDVQGLQVWLTRYVSKYFDSAFMQELEWHFHTALFALVLGFGTIYNTHVRVDLIRDHLNFRSKANLEFAGLTFFMIPYLLLTIYFAIDYVMGSYRVGEVSPSAIGLSHRWVIKSILVAGLLVALIAGIAVWLQTAYLIWGDTTKRFDLMTLDWPELAGGSIEGKTRISLEDAPDTAPATPIPGVRGVVEPTAKEVAGAVRKAAE